MERERLVSAYSAVARSLPPRARSMHGVAGMLSWESFGVALRWQPNTDRGSGRNGKER